MIDREHEQLLHDVVGGQASPADVTRLETWLETNAEGLQRRKEIETLFAALAAVPRVPPPAELRDDVLAAIRAGSRAAAAPARRRVPRAWFLVPVGAAVLAVALASPLWRQSLRPESLQDVSGALAARPAPRPARAALAFAGTRVAMSATTSGAGTLVSFDATSTTPLTIELEADAATVLGISVDGLSPDAIRPDAAHGRLELVLDGSTRFSLGFRPALRREESVKVVVRAGERRAEGVLPQPGEER
jgi:anti-sigma factor RsiW